MLTALTTGLRFRLAVTLAIFATLCFVVPPAAQAIGHGTNTIDCLAHAGSVNHGNAVADHSTHRGDHSAPAGDHKMACCSLICLSALAVDGGVATPTDAGSTPVPAHETRLPSCVPDRLDRPPISLLVA